MTVSILQLSVPHGSPFWNLSRNGSLQAGREQIKQQKQKF